MFLALHQLTVSAILTVSLFFINYTINLPPVFDFTSTISYSSVNQKKKKFYGTASYYAAKFQGRKTASGQLFDHAKLTAACNVLPIGTWVKVTNLKNKKSVKVRINDRLHPKMTRIVDLTSKAAEEIGMLKAGLARVEVEVVKK